MKKKIVVLTGAGVSAESGINTFRDSDGLWENHRIEDVCTPLALATNKPLVLDFYNKRRLQLIGAKPNSAHTDLVRLEEDFDVEIITQNVDDLHEKAGSSKITHLHGELMKVRSMGDEKLIYDIDETNYITKMEDKCEKGYPLRPHIVFFGEAVPMIDVAVEICSKADIMIIIGTSLNVYPAAGLVDYKPKHCPVYFIDPKPNVDTATVTPLTVFEKKATTGMRELLLQLL